MCDQSEVIYKPEDIVWVKLSSLWWPAEVQDKNTLDPEILRGLRKSPVAVVKFFNEDCFEYPKSLNQIYHYNCRRKEEFTKKGLDLWHAYLKNPNSRSFPQSINKFYEDVTLAEKKTNGDSKFINMYIAISDEKKSITKRPSISPETPRKKSKLDKGLLGSTSKTLKKEKSPRISFASTIESYSDTPGDRSIKKRSSSLSKKSLTPKSVLQRSSRTVSDSPNSLKENNFCCVFCKYKSPKTSLIFSHLEGHYRGAIKPRPRQIPPSFKEIFEENLKSSVKSYDSKKKRTQDTLRRKTKLSITSDSTKDSQIKLKSSPAKKPDSGKKSLKKTKSESRSEEATEILRDWDSDDENLNEHKSQQGNLQLASPASSLQKKDLSYCFDFQEDHDESINLCQSMKFGQKLPRVISDKESLRTPSKSGSPIFLKNSSKPNDEKEYKSFDKKVAQFLKDSKPKLPQIPTPIRPESSYATIDLTNEDDSDVSLVQSPSETLSKGPVKPKVSSSAADKNTSDDTGLSTCVKDSIGKPDIKDTVDSVIFDKQPFPASVDGSDPPEPTACKNKNIVQMTEHSDNFDLLVKSKDLAADPHKTKEILDKPEPHNTVLKSDSEEVMPNIDRLNSGKVVLDEKKKKDQMDTFGEGICDELNTKLDNCNIETETLNNLNEFSENLMPLDINSMPIVIDDGNQSFTELGPSNAQEGIKKLIFPVYFKPKGAPLNPDMPIWKLNKPAPDFKPSHNFKRIPLYKEEEASPKEPDVLPDVVLSNGIIIRLKKVQSVLTSKGELDKFISFDAFIPPDVPKNGRFAVVKDSKTGKRRFCYLTPKSKTSLEKTESCIDPPVGPCNQPAASQDVSHVTSSVGDTSSEGIQ